MVAEHGVSERMACRVLGQHRSTQRKIPTTPDDEAALTADIVALAIQYGCYGYRRITALLRQEAVSRLSQACAESTPEKDVRALARELCFRLISSRYSEQLSLLKVIP